jgi:hypothetical protein
MLHEAIVFEILKLMVVKIVLTGHVVRGNSGQQFVVSEAHG